MQNLKVDRLHGEKNNGLEFELEIKKKAIKSVQNLLFVGQIEEFEEILTQHFYRQFKDSLVQNTCYTDWLLINLRKTLQKKKPKNSLVSTYLKNNKLHSVVEKQHFLRLLQFLSFSRKLTPSKFFLHDQAYYTITFLLTDFLKFEKIDEKNQYQRSKALIFLKTLQEIKPLVRKFSETSFQSLVIFPYIRLEKRGRFWSVTMSISEQLFLYNYPFFSQTILIAIRINMICK
jgi:hypothetical protein